ncbi:DNRLRE domain-containing protein [Solwaraspora sp. WMMA2101]|uniref:DNRLRE domain-containing protein n=1 Tax=Solwaraspora sp. WMMA2101 TaxID=3404124 RepID=UPI003B933A34
MDSVSAGFNRSGRLVVRLGLVGGRLARWVTYLLTAILVVTLADWAVRKPAVAAPAGEEQTVDEPAGELERPDEAAALVTARMTGKRVRITGLTSETSEFWALPDGQVEVEAHLGPVRLPDGEGGWRPVDFTLAPQPDGSVAARAHPNDLRLSGAADDGEHDLLSLGLGEDRLALGWSGRLPAPVVSGTRATYQEVRPGVDLVVESTRTGFQQFLIVKNRGAVEQVGEVPLTLRGTGLAVAEDGLGGWEVLGDDGDRVGVVPAPVMWDAQVHEQSGEQVRKAPVDVRVSTRRGGDTEFELTPSMEWLSDPGTVFPVTIDPSVTLNPNYDAFVQNGYTTDQSTVNELKLGTYDGGTNKARSFLSFRNLAWLQGKQVQSANLYLWNYHSWSCEARQWQAWSTSYVDYTARWTNQPTWIKVVGTSSQTKGYNSSCGDGWVSVPVTTAFADLAAFTTQTTVNIGLQATSETDNLSWKRFHSVENTKDPYVTLVYQVPPTVTARATVPSVPCHTSTSGAPYINTKTPQLRAQVTDTEGSQVTTRFEWWVPATSAPIGATTVGPGASGSWLATVVPSGAFAEGNPYSWRARGSDSTSNGPWTSWCYFYIDTVAPSAMPTVSSTTYPSGQWAGGVGTAGAFTFGASGVADVAAYEYGLNANPPNQSVNAASLGGGASVSITPTQDGPQTLYVRSRDRAGNQSAIRSYTFNVGSGAVTGPKAGDIAAAKTAITGVGQTAATGVTYQWRRADTDTWVNIPTGHVSLAAGGAVTSWPVATTGGGAFPKLNWDVEATLAAVDAQSIARNGPLQLRGVFVGGTGGTSSAVTFTFDRDQATAASSSIGPGSVNLITGNYSLSDTDVSVGSYGTDLTVTRSYNSRRATATDSANMFGPGWVSGVLVEESESPYTSLTVYGSLVQVGLPEGDTLGFTKRTATDFDSEPGMEFLRLTYASGPDSYSLTDEDGNLVTFTRVSGSAAGKYFPTAVTVPGSSQTTTISWERVTIGGTEIVRPTRMLAPVADGVACTTLIRGCRALTFTYATSTTATGTTEAGWGDYLGRVRQVSFTAWDPDLSTPAMRTIAVAGYAYDNAGRLRAVWDPRLDYVDGTTTHHLWETYSYNLDGVLASVRPTAEEPWQLTYTTLPGDSGLGRLHQVSRSALSAGTATTTVVYKVPTSGTGAPYDLSFSQTVRWGQVEAPTDATAVFPANQVPSGSPSTGALPSSYERATVTYMDANARETNVAVPGGGISATWFDQWGNTTRTLSAGNRRRALDASGSDDSAAETALAFAHSTLNIYSDDGQRLISTLAPEHDVTLPDGTVVRGRQHTRNTYDQGAPTTGGPYNLVTTAEVMVRWWNTAGVATDSDVRTTTTAYDWGLRQPTVATVDPAGLALATRTTYDPITGLEVTTTAPAGGTSTTTPSTRRTVYYRATSGSGHSECDLRPEWANLPCRIEPGGQAGSGPELPVTVTTYDMFNQPRTVVEKTSAGTLRTTTTSYDVAGRMHEVAVSTAPGLGAAVPVTRNVYEAATGRHLRTQSIVGGTVTAEVIRTFDMLGRQTSYTDSDGNVSTTTYDLLGRTATSSDGKATRTYTYDGGTERRGLLTSVDDTQAGVFTGGYDVEGNLTSETWPSGITVAHEYDETGTSVGITYVRPGCGASDCTLYSGSVAESVHGQWRQHASTLAEQTYTYDASGRLTTVEDTIGGQCTTRSYAFSASSNRDSLVEYAPAGDGTCQTGTAASTVTFSYDTADRITTAGTVYDALGRTTTVPAADTATPTAGNATVGYHVTDLVDTITQAGRTVDYAVDVTGERVRSFTDTADGTPVTTVHHYDDDGDNPAWTQENVDTWTRIVSGVSGMGGIWNSDNGQVTWRLANLHGDLVATINPDDVGLSATTDASEYGTPRNPDAIGGERYGWLGAKQRASDPATGLILMGVRLYNTTTGRFLTVDPVYGGSCNAYEYTCADPLNKEDLDGKWVSLVIRGAAAACKLGRNWCKRAAVWTGKQAWRGAKWAGRKAWSRAKRSWTGTRNFIRNTSIRCHRFPNVGGFGCDLRYKGTRKFGVHYHRVKGKYRPHYHRRPGIGKHRPWEGGW